MAKRECFRNQLRGLGDEVIQQLALPEGDALLDRFVDLLAAMKANLAGFFTVTVDYDRRLERIIEDGRYDWTNPHISSKNFPIEGKGKIDLKIELAHFSRVMESDEVLQELNSQALRPATLPELLAFGASHPDQQRRFPIVALASIWRDGRGRRLVAYLTSIDSERNLYLIPLAGGWHTNYHFAAVRT